MRAVEVRPDTGALQEWADMFIFLASYGVLGQALVCAILSFVSGELEAPATPKTPGQVDVDALLDREKVLLEERKQEWERKKTATSVKRWSYLKFASMGAVYTGSVGVILAMTNIKATATV